MPGSYFLRRPDVGEAGMVKRPAQKGFHLLIEPLADTAHLRFGDAAGPAQRLHQGIDLLGGDPAGVGLHHHGVERLCPTTIWLRRQPPNPVEGGVQTRWPMFESCCWSTCRSKSQITSGRPSTAQRRR